MPSFIALNHKAKNAKGIDLTIVRTDYRTGGEAGSVCIFVALFGFFSVVLRSGSVPTVLLLWPLPIWALVVQEKEKLFV